MSCQLLTDCPGVSGHGNSRGGMFASMGRPATYEMVGGPHDGLQGVVPPGRELSMAIAHRDPVNFAGPACVHHLSMPVPDGSHTRIRWDDLQDHIRHVFEICVEA